LGEGARNRKITPRIRITATIATTIRPHRLGRGGGGGAVVAYGVAASQLAWGAEATGLGRMGGDGLIAIDLPQY
jgi:hypothetical protein